MLLYIVKLNDDLPWQGLHLAFLPASKLEAMARRLIADFRSVIVLAGTGHLIIQFSTTLYSAVLHFHANQDIDKRGAGRSDRARFYRYQILFAIEHIHREIEAPCILSCRRDHVQSLSLL